MSRRAYPTDLPDAQWAILEPFVPAAKYGGRPSFHPHHELVNAMLSVLRSGGAWQVVPHEFPPWQTVYHYFRLWRDDGTWERMNAAQHRLRVCRFVGANGRCRFSISQSTGCHVCWVAAA
ncbi:hypothetical protein BH20CHL2_BH20CHL2_10140 [soil metagenome]|jgi:transposase